MEQIIEGLDNEVALLLFFTTTIIALVVPLYVARIFYPREPRNRTPDNSSGNQNASPAAEDSNSSKTGASPVNNSFEIPSDNQPAPTPKPPLGESDSSHSSSSRTNASTSSQARDNSANVRNPTSETSGTDQQEFLLKVKVQESTYEQFVNKSLTLLELKRKFFPRELEEGKQIRFVYAGKILSGDQQKIETFGINKATVVQCVISESTGTSSTSGQPQAGAPPQDADLDLSMVMYIMYGLLLFSSWSMMFWFEDWFSNMGILLLSLLSVIGYFLLL